MDSFGIFNLIFFNFIFGELLPTIIGSGEAKVKVYFTDAVWKFVESSWIPVILFMDLGCGVAEAYTFSDLSGETGVGNVGYGVMIPPSSTK